jgi:hypothetical protein
LDTGVVSDPAIRERQATIDCRLGKIDSLRADLLAGAWGRAKSEATEFAFGALTATRRDEAALAAQMWTQALDVARGDPETMAVLLRLAETSGLRAQTTASFDALVSAPQDAETGSHPGLDSQARRREVAWRFFSWARQQGDDELAQRAARAWLDADPANEYAQLAWSRMVLNRRDAANLAAAVAQVEGLCRKRSDCLPLLAFARHVEGRDADAILILSKITPAQLSPDENEWIQSVATRLGNVFEAAPP